MLRLSARLQMVAMHSDRHSRYREGIICTSGHASAARSVTSTCHVYSAVHHTLERLLSFQGFHRHSSTQNCSLRFQSSYRSAGACIDARSAQSPKDPRPITADIKMQMRRTLKLVGCASSNARIAAKALSTCAATASMSAMACWTPSVPMSCPRAQRWAGFSPPQPAASHSAVSLPGASSRPAHAAASLMLCTRA